LETLLALICDTLKIEMVKQSWDKPRPDRMTQTTKEVELHTLKVLERNRQKNSLSLLTLFLFA